MAWALKVEDFSYSYPGNGEAILRSLSFTVNRGECVCITGSSGAGKSTLLLAIQGLLKGGHCNGRITIDANGWKKPVGLLFQNVDSQILCSTVEEEAAFGPDAIGFTGEETAAQAHHALQSVGLAGFEKRNVDRLSAGEKQRVALAAVLSSRPAVVLLDEPTSQLDEQGKADLVQIIHELKRQGHALLIADHEPGVFHGVVDRLFQLEKGCLRERSFGFFHGSGSYAPGPGGADSSKPASSAEPALEMDGIVWTEPNGKVVLDCLSLRIGRGEFVYLYGENGAGKSSLLRLMVGLESPQAGSIRTAGITAPKPEQLVGNVGLLFQNPQKQLFEDSVFSEAAFTLRMLKYGEREVMPRVNGALALCEVERFAERSPFTLSYGEQHRVALASVIAANPEVLLLDEPFAGLDFPQRRRMLTILSRLQRNGTTIILASHGPLPAGEWVNRHIILKNGKISEG